jgi:tetratricopeptide (TPR) repeat protein
MRSLRSLWKSSLRGQRPANRRGASGRSRLRVTAGPVVQAVAAAFLVGFWVVGCHAEQKETAYKEDPIRAGNQALDEMRLSDAKAFFEEALKQGQDTPRAKFGLAEVDLRSGRFQDAERLYREAIDAQAKEGGKDLPEAHAMLGIILIETDRWQEGAKEIHTASQLDSNCWPAIYGEARLLMRDHKWDEAEKLLNKGAKKKGVSQGEDLFHHGWGVFYLGTNDLTMAETSALSAFHLNPSDPWHGKLVAQVYEKRNVPALAIAACEEALQTSGVPPTASFVHFMGTLYQKAGRYTEARDSYQRAVEIDSTYAPVLKDWAGLMTLAKQYDRAAQIYLRYVQLQPNDVDALVGLSGALYDAGRYAQALDVASKAMGMDSTKSSVRIAYARAAIRNRDPVMRDRGAQIYTSLPDTLHWQSKDRVLLASYQIENGQQDLARANLQQVIATDSTYAEAYFQLGLLALKTQGPEAAIVQFDKAISHDPKVPLYYLNAGVAQFQAKRFDKAIPAFRSAIKLDPRFVSAHSLLGQALIAVDSLSAAEKEYQRAAEIDPTNGGVLRGLGYCYLKRGAYKEASDVYKKATTAEPRNTDGWVGLGQAYMGLGDIAAAEDALRQAQGIDPNNASLRASWDLLKRAKQGGG